MNIVLVMSRVCRRAKSGVAKDNALQLKHTKMGKPRGLYTARKQVSDRRDNRWVCMTLLWQSTNTTE